MTTPPIVDEPDNEGDLTEGRRPGPTPNGGVSSVAYFMDTKGNPAPKLITTNIEIHELDKDGNSIFRTYGTLGPLESPD